MKVPFLNDLRDRSRNAGVGVVLVLISFFSINTMISDVGRSLKWDLTENGIYTLTDSTRTILGSLDEPITLRLFYSLALDERAPSLSLYHDQVKTVLEKYASLGDGQILLEYFDPEPFSETEDRATASGMQGLPLSDAGDQAYFGLVISNSTDDWDAIPFLSPDREGFLEYDLTRMIYNLANPDKPVVGVLSSVPLLGTQRDNRPMAVLENVGEFFEVRHLSPMATDISESIDVVLIVHPRDISLAMQYALDQFVLGGGRALVFVDSHAEMDALYAEREGALPGRSDFNRLLNAWGLILVDDIVAADIDNAQRVSYSENGQPLSVDYVGWLSLRSRSFDARDAVMAELSALNLATSGVLDIVPGTNVTISPMIVTGPRSMRIDVGEFGATPDVVGLFRGFQPSGRNEILAARVSGETATAFPDGAPSSSVDPTTHLDRSAAPLNLIVVADVDMLDDRFWVDRRNVLGQEMQIPLANNGDFVLNALENLSGSPALISLRGRSVISRPFEMVDSIRLEAERKYRDKEQELLANLRSAEDQISDLMPRSTQGDEVIISEADENAIEALRVQVFALRGELRVVQHELLRDIDRLETILKIMNIGALPVVLAGVMIVVVSLRRRKRLETAFGDGT